MYRSLSLRGVLRAAACKLAAKLHDAPRKPTAEACHTSAGAVIVEFRPGAELPAKPRISPAALEAERRRTNLEAACLGVCTADTPLKGVVIARRIGHEYDSYLRGTLARLVRDGRLRRATNGLGYLLG